MSTLKADTIQNTSGGAVTLTNQSAAKAWVNFNGTGTIAARDSLNLSSLIDNSNGIYSFNFSNSMGAATYSIATGGNYALTSFVPNIAAPCNTYSTSQFQFECNNTAFNAFLDYEYVSANIDGDLA